MRKIAPVSLLTILLCQLSQAETISFVTQPSFAPFNYSVMGEAKGTSVSIIRKVCEEIKAECTIQMMPWPRAQIEAREGKFNAIFTVGWNLARTDWLYYSYPMMETEYGFFELDEGESLIRDFNDIKSLKDKTVIVYGPSNTSKRLYRLQESIKKLGLTFDIDLFSKNSVSIKKLIMKRGNLLFSNRDAGQALILGAGHDKKINYIGPAFPPHHYYIGFSKNKQGNGEIFKRFNTAYGKLLDSGWVKDLLNKKGQILGDIDKGKEKSDFINEETY